VWQQIADNSRFRLGTGRVPRPASSEVVGQRPATARVARGCCTHSQRVRAAPPRWSRSGAANSA